MMTRSFVRKKVQSLTLGEKLRQLREDRHLRTQDLSRKINVKVQYIDALERSDYDHLPTKVYAKGFVRSYARFFGVPEDVLINLFEREYSIYRNITHKDEEETVSRLPKVPRFVFTPRILAVFLSVIVLCGVGMYLYFGVDNFISSPWMIIEEPLNNSVVTNDSVMVRGKTRVNSRVTVNGQQVFVDVDGNFSDKIDLSPGTNVINVHSINRFDKETQRQIVIDAQYSIEQSAQESNAKNIQLFVKAENESIWINVVADGVDVYNDTIEIDEEMKFNAADQILITTSSGRNTLIAADGENYAPITEDDQIVKEWVYNGQEEQEKLQDPEEDQLIEDQE
jgi:transcriptional regulator with XRE-family HTH domain